MTHAPVRSSSRRFASAHGGSTVWGHQTGTEPRTGIQRQKSFRSGFGSARRE